MNRAKVICHMYMTIDGKTITDLPKYPDCEIAGNIYDEKIFSMAKAWGCGRATFMYLSDANVNLDNYAPKEGKLVDKVIKDEIYCFAFDRKGRLFFTDVYNDYAGHNSRLVSVLTESVDRRLLTYLDSKGISYIFCGKQELDLNLFLEKIKKLDIETFMLCGGAQINALFMAQDLVDELSIIICPGVQGGRQEIGIVGTEDISAFPKYFKVKDVNILPGDTVWLRYTK